MKEIGTAFTAALGAELLVVIGIFLGAALVVKFGEIGIWLLDYTP